MLNRLASLTSAPRALALGIGAGALMLTLLVLTLVFWDDVLPEARADRRQDAQADAAQLAAAHAAIVARASEADAVRFGKVRVNAIGADPAVCGLVDIDAPQDSLAGEERFVFVDGELTLESEDGSAAVAQVWNAVCDG